MIKRQASRDLDLDLDVDLSSVSNSVSRSTPNLSGSKKKLGLNFDDTINESIDDSDSENVHSRDYNNFGNRIIDISALFRLFPSASLLVAHLGLNPDPNPNPNP